MSPIKMSKIESAARLVMAFNSAFNQHDVPSMLQLFSDDCVVESFHPPPGGTEYRGKIEAAAYWTDLFATLPKAQAEIEDIFGLGKRCVMRWKLSWQDQAGHEAHLRGVDIFRIKDDLVIELLSYGKTLPAAR